jgi:hypothetical protein
VKYSSDYTKAVIGTNVRSGSSRTNFLIINMAVANTGYSEIYSYKLLKSGAE